MIFLDKTVDLKLYEDKEGITLQYVEQSFSPTENTGVTLYDKYKISIMLSFGMFAVTENIAYKAEIGDIFVFRPDEIHFAKITDQKVHKFLNIFIPTDFFKKLQLDAKDIENFLEHKNGKNLIRPSFSESEKIIPLINEIIAPIKNDENVLKIDTFSKILKILSLLSRYYKNTTETEKDIPKVVVNTLDYISKNFGSKISLYDIAKENYCSVTYLSKIFKKHTGYTVYEQLLNVRLINAKKMLKEGKNVTEVSFDCGFTDCSHFIKTFKKLTGLTPYQYKKAD
jgi:AraC-like DNA-binding protein